jgi:hypothetical protein
LIAALDWISLEICWGVKKETSIPGVPTVGEDLLGNDLGGVKHVIGKLGCERFIKGLDTEFPLRIVTARNRVEKITPMEIWIGTGDFYGLVPNRGLNALFWLPVELDES